jgi:hypothetical protein
MVEPLSSECHCGRGGPVGAEHHPDCARYVALPSKPSNVYDDGELWSFIRRCMAQGKDIHLDHAERTYEEYSARLDLAALERLPELQSYIVRAVVAARATPNPGVSRHLHCIGYSPTLSGFGVREGGPEGELIATFKRQADADAYIRPNALETGACAWSRPDRGDGHLSAFVKTECGASFHIPPGIDIQHKFCGNCGKATALKASELQPHSLTALWSGCLCAWCENERTKPPLNGPEQR